MRNARHRGARHALRGRGGRDALSSTLPSHALILTAGLGTRFLPLSHVRAKAAVPIAGRPLIHRIIGWLASYGIADLVLNLHHKPETITRLVGDGSALGARVRYSWEDPILGSGGGPRRAAPFIASDTFFIINGDTLTNLDLAAMWRTHAASGARVTMALIRNPRPDFYGGVLVERDRVVRFVPRGIEQSSYHFIGVQIASADVFEPLDPDRPAESVSQLYPHLIAADPGAVGAFISDAEFEDVGTPRDYLETALRVAAREGIAGPLTGRGARVDSSATIRDTVLWDDVTVGPRSVLTRCVVADRVSVPADSSYENAAIVSGPDGAVTVVSFDR